MKKVGSYDQYRQVLDSDNTTILHVSSGCNLIHATDLLEQDAISYAKTVFEGSKSLGSFNVVQEKEDTGYYELLIEFPDKRLLYRTIYVY